MLVLLACPSVNPDLLDASLLEGVEKAIDLLLNLITVMLILNDYGRGRLVNSLLGLRALRVSISVAYCKALLSLETFVDQEDLIAEDGHL